MYVTLLTVCNWDVHRYDTDMLFQDRTTCNCIIVCFILLLSVGFTCDVDWDKPCKVHRGTMDV